jgi:PAS domain S-box-containing protein
VELVLQNTPYTIPLVIAIVVSAVGGVAAWSQREGQTEIYLVWVQFALALWGLTMLLTLSATSLVWKRRFLSLFVPTVPLLVVACLLFVLRFTGRSEWDTPARRALLALFPICSFVLGITNGMHELVFVNPQLNTGGSYVELTYSLGPGMYAIAAIEAAIVGTYIRLTFRKFLRSRNVYRNLSFVFLAGFVLITIAYVLSLSGLSPFPHFVLGLLTFLFIGTVMILGASSVRIARKLPVDRLLSVVGSRLGSTAPLARDFVVQEVDSGIVIVDSDDRIVDINTTATKMLGLDRPVGKRLVDVTRLDWVLDGDDLVPVLTGDRPVHELTDEVWVQTRRGERCYDVTISALTDDAETVAHVVLMYDITDQKERQEKLEDQKQELAFQKRQLEHQNERLDRFAGIVSHDLRNPLSVVDGNLELLEQQFDEDTDTVELERETLESLTTASERMSNIIDDALTLARQGKAITDTTSAELASVAEEAWETVDTDQASLCVTVDWAVEADRGRLLNVFENLFRNAVEHGPPDVTVTVGRREDGDGFYVADDGPGIPDDDRDDVFDHGYSTRTEGTGLGLAIVRDIIRAHGWTISVGDGADGGARFDIVGVSFASNATDDAVSVADQQS